MLKIAIIGALGKMGQELVNFALNQQAKNHCIFLGGGVRDKIDLSYNPHHSYYTTDIHHLIKTAALIIDFTSAEYSLYVADIATQHQTMHICGTTGFTEQQFSKLKNLAKENVIFHSANMSITVALLSKLVQQAAIYLDDDFDVEILDTHHRFKADSPSGTALMLGEAAAVARNIDFNQAKTYPHQQMKSKDSIGFASLRTGGIIGEHTVFFSSPVEQLILTHKSFDRKIYAQGAFKIAYWAQTQAPGRLLTMGDYISANFNSLKF